MSRKTKTDPTGQAVSRRRATRQIQKRITSAQREVMRVFRAVPRKRRRETVLPNAKVVPVYDYQITADELEAMAKRISSVVDLAVLGTEFNRMPPNWWWQSTIEQPYRAGAAEEIVAFNRLVTAELVRTRTARGLSTQRLEIGFVLQSAEYLAALDKVYVQSFNSISALSARTADQVAQRINAGISGKKTPTEIAEDIAERFDVSRSSADRLAQTEVNQAYNNAKLDSANIAAKQTGMRAGVLHLSALIMTTRTGHAARHGNAYTVAQQRQWWDSGTNRIRCHCSTRSVLIDADSKVLDVELQEEIQAEREFFNE